MTTSHPHHPLILNVLQQVTPDRLQRAVTALAEGSLTVTLTRQTATEVRAVVKNGDSKEYGVTVTETGAFCSCPDALYRGAVCKHATLVALSVLRLPQEDQSHEAERKPDLTLARVRPGWIASA